MFLEAHACLLFYKSFIDFKTLFEDEMDVIDIPISELISPKECEEFIGTHIRTVHHEEVDTEKAFGMVTARESPSVDLEFDIMIDITIGYESENSVSFYDEFFYFPVFGEYFPHPVEDVLFIETRIHEIEIQICGESVESIEE